MQSPPASADVTRVSSFASRMGPTRRISQVNVMVHQLAQTQVVGQGHRQDQPSIGHQAVVIKGNVDAIGAFRM